MAAKTKNKANRGKPVNPYTHSGSKVKKKETSNGTAKTEPEPPPQVSKKENTLEQSKTSESSPREISKQSDDNSQNVLEKKGQTNIDTKDHSVKDTTAGNKETSMKSPRDSESEEAKQGTTENMQQVQGSKSRSNNIQSSSKDTKNTASKPVKSKQPERKVDSTNRDRSRNTQDKVKPGKSISDSDKKQDSRVTGSKQSGKVDEMEKANKPNEKAAENIPNNKKAEEGKASKVAEDEKHNKRSETGDTDKPVEAETKKAPENGKKTTADESETSDDSDSEEEESDEEEDPLIAKLASKYNLKVEEPLEPVIEVEEEEQERIMTAKSNVVDLCSLSLRYNAKNRSALKPILVDYGLPDPHSDQEYPTEEKVIKKKKIKKSRALDVESDREGRQGRDFEHALKIRELLSQDYMQKLQERVAEQRKEIKQRSEQLEQKLLNMEQKKRDATKFQKKLQRHDLTHDATVLRAIPKSNAYKMVGWEKKLRSQDKLKTRDDVDEFWSYSENEAALKEYLKRQGLGTPSPAHSSPDRSVRGHLEDSFSSSRTSSMSSITQEKEHTIDFTRTLTQIEETKEPSRPSTRDPNSTTPWAVTQLSPAKHGRSTQSPPKGSRSLSPMKTNVSIASSPTRKPQDPHTIAKLAAAELDKKHPMKELPPLNCLAVNIDEDAKDPEQLLKELQYNRREKERKLFVKRIRSMYQRSKANIASTNRILDQRFDDFTLDDEAPPTDTWLSSYDLAPVKEPAREPVHPDIQYLQDHPWLKHIRRRAIATILEESEPPSGVQSQKTSASIAGRRPASQDVPTRPSSIHSYQPSVIPPLSMETLERDSTVIEAKGLSTLWTNYLGVGKSVFAQ